MNRDKELFQLAKDYVMLFDLYEKARLDDGEFAEQMNEIRNKVLKGGYNIDKFVWYQELYREMTIAEYYEFLKTLD